MKLFLSWSTEESHLLAKAFEEWLPSVLQRVAPFISSEDIQKGSLWFPALGDELEATDFGLLCLTRYNLEAPWILFEAGALSKRVTNARVIPFLLGVSPAELKPPLSHFNACQANEADVRGIVQTINAALGDDGLPEPRLKAAFAKWWPDLQTQLEHIETKLAERTKKQPPPAQRSVEDKIDELLKLTRRLVLEREMLARIGGLTDPQPSNTNALLENARNALNVLKRTGLDAAALSLPTDNQFRQALLDSLGDSDVKRRAGVLPPEEN